jgi:hypothetical protein
MNKYLMLQAALLFATAGVASADEAGKSGSATIGLNSFCSSYVMHWDGPFYAVEVVRSPNCSSANFFDLGIAGKTKGIGQNLNLAVPPPPGTSFEALGLDIALPLKTGGAWTLYAATGPTIFVLNSGTYTVRNGRQATSGSRMSVVRQAIEQLKARDKAIGH